MHYIDFKEPGGAQVLYVAQGPVPKMGDGDVLIEVEAAGVSRADALQRSGKYPPPKGFSTVLGLEVCGTVVAAGKDVTTFSPGDNVCALCNGAGYAEFAAVPAGQVLPLPATWSFVEGATLPENAFTVFDALFTRARLKAGEILLVHGGSSGIGTTAIMFAVAMGARVIATAGSPLKCDAAAQLGAEAAIDYKTADFVQSVREHTHKRGVDVVLDIVGGDYINRDLTTLALDGRIACIATGGGTEALVDLRQLLARRATILGSSLRPRTSAEKARIAADLSECIWPMLEARDPIVPVIDSIFTFSQAVKAHERLESSEHIGKIVLVPDAARPD